MPIDRYEFAKNTDMIHNVYDCGHTTGNAMGNKYYDGIILVFPRYVRQAPTWAMLLRNDR